MPRRPNLLFLFTDEQRRDTMACYGNDFVQTPALNRLADESFVFENAYVTQPVCTPSRATIMTGQYPHTCGCTANNIPLRPETRTIAEMAPEEYSCAYYGKWHLGDEIFPQHGFSRFVSIEDNYRAHYSRPECLDQLSDYHHFLVSKGFTPDAMRHGAKVFNRRTAARLPEEMTKAAFLGRGAADFIRKSGDRPFMLHVNFLEPHMPFTGPFDDLYPPDRVPVGPQFHRAPAGSSRLHELMAEHYLGTKVEGCDLSTEAGARRLRAQYLGLVTLVDRAVANILAALEESGPADNTIVVFTSDHGDMMGDHGIVAKCVMYEEAVTVPLLMRVPWLGRRNRRVPGRVSQVDLVPTLLELMDLPVPACVDGVGRRDVFEGGSPAGNDVFIQWNGRDGALAAQVADKPDEEGNRFFGRPWRNIVSADGWKLNLCAGDRCELYDLNSDPCEMRNLIDDPAQRERIRDLAARVRAWQEQVGDDVPLPVL